MCSNSGRSVISAVLAVALFAASVPRPSLGAEPTAADKSIAQETFAAGMELRDKGDHKAALPKFRAAYDHVPSPITALELGRAWMLTGKLVEARERFLDVARMPPKPSESNEAKAARIEAEQLAKDVGARIPTLTIWIEGSNEASVYLDGGGELARNAVGTPLPVNPGHHKILARAANLPDQESEIDVKEGTAKSVSLAFPRDSVTPREGTRTLAYVGFGVAGAGLVTGVVTLAARAGRISDCRNQLASGAAECSGTGTLDTVAILSFVVAGIGAGVGIYGLLTPSGAKGARGSGPRVGAWVGWQSAGIEGVF